MNDSKSIDDEELLYRKVSVNSGWYDPVRRELKPDAFNPRQDDNNGISFDRAKSVNHPEFRSIREASQGASSGGYYCAVFLSSCLRSKGFTIVSNSLRGNPGHALLKDLTYTNRKEPQSREKMVLLSHDLVDRVEGPFMQEGGDPE